MPILVIALGGLRRQPGVRGEAKLIPCNEEEGQ